MKKILALVAAFVAVTVVGCDGAKPTTAGSSTTVKATTITTSK